MFVLDLALRVGCIEMAWGYFDIQHYPAFFHNWCNLCPFPRSGGRALTILEVHKHCHITFRLEGNLLVFSPPPSFFAYKIVLFGACAHAGVLVQH